MSVAVFIDGLLMSSDRMNYECLACHGNVIYTCIYIERLNLVVTNL